MKDEKRKAISYASSGVNYSLMDAFKNACIKAGSESTQLLEFENYYLIDILEGIGSLSQLADDIYKISKKDFYYQVGWGNGASIVNDLIAVGAKPLTFKLFLAAGSEKWFTDKPRWKNLIKGFKDAAKHSNASWNGGETQTLVNVVNKDSIVLAGSSMGIVQPKSQLIDEKNITEGDRILFFSSSGVHTNGITLIRKIFKNDIDTQILAVKEKTIIYSPIILELLSKEIDIHYATHITGHGWRKIMRSKRNFTYKINQIPKSQEIFNKIQKKAKLTDFQMYSDFNMGLGFAIFVPQSQVKKSLNISRKLGFEAMESGRIESGARKVIIEPLGIVLEGKSLVIR